MLQTYCNAIVLLVNLQLFFKKKIEKVRADL